MRTDSVQTFQTGNATSRGIEPGGLSICRGLSLVTVGFVSGSGSGSSSRSLSATTQSLTRGETQVQALEQSVKDQQSNNADDVGKLEQLWKLER
jgi:hypothetical protein